MALKNDVLFELMNSSVHISGEVLARKFGKSRAAVWKAVKSLIADGYEIDAIKNNGYKLIGGTKLVSESIIKSLLEREMDVIHFPCVDSTNNCCKRMIAEGREGEFLVVADEQTAGRGRQGKSFFSPKLNGIYFTVVLKPYTALQNAVTATTAAAVAVCRAIEALTDKKPKIKWVNDVYLDGKKICGILTEAITNFEENITESVIVGIGVNITPSDAPQEIENIGFLNTEVDKNQLIAQITNELVKIACSDYKNFIDYYRSHSLVIGQKIKIIHNNRVVPATAVAIDETGGLEIELENGEHQILRSGEISIRKG